MQLKGYRREEGDLWGSKEISRVSGVSTLRHRSKRPGEKGRTMWGSEQGVGKRVISGQEKAHGLPPPDGCDRRFSSEHFQ